MMVLIDLPIIQFTCQHHTSGYVCRVWHLFVFFLLLIEIISIAKLLITAHFLVLKHEKQALSYIHTKFEGDKNNSFFLQFILWEHLFFCPNTENYLGLRGWCPWNYLVWIVLKQKKKKPTLIQMLTCRSRALGSWCSWRFYTDTDLPPPLFPLHYGCL